MELKQRVTLPPVVVEVNQELVDAFIQQLDDCMAGSDGDDRTWYADMKDRAENLNFDSTDIRHELANFLHFSPGRFGESHGLDFGGWSVNH